MVSPFNPTQQSSLGCAGWYTSHTRTKPRLSAMNTPSPLPSVHAAAVSSPPPSQPQSGSAGEANGDAAITSLRSAIDAKLREDVVYRQIRELILSKAALVGARNVPAIPEVSSPENDVVKTTVDEPKSSVHVDDELIREILQSELVQHVLASVKNDRHDGQQGESACHSRGLDHNEMRAATITAATSTAPEQQIIYLRLAGGRAFVDQLTNEATECDNEDPNQTNGRQHHVGDVCSFFRVVVAFQSQRLSSRDVPCCVDPAFDEHFRLRVTPQPTRAGRTKSGELYEVEVVEPWEALCLVAEPIRVFLLQVTKRVVASNPSTSHTEWRELRRELMATHALDWRRVLCSTTQLVHFPVSLVDKMKVPVGSLDFRADLLHVERTAMIARDVTAFLSKDTLEQNTRRHTFYRHAKEWWQEYRSETKALEENIAAHGGRENSHERAEELLFERAAQRQRLVKLFAEDDEGCFRMMSKFLAPLRAPSAVRSPSEAARFVALLPHEHCATIGNGASDEVWRSMAAFLVLGKGSVQDHAVLLASLLLGCGLDAYVCIGTITTTKQVSHSLRSPLSRSTAAVVGHVWVMTRSTYPDKPDDILFWESLTGERHYLRRSASAASRHGYRSIDCVFSGTHFYANLQPQRWKLSDCSFTLEDEAAWKAMNPQLIANLPFPQPTMTLVPPDYGACLAQEQLWSTTLRKQISSHRRASGFATRWSDELSFYLLPALNSYEMERVYGVAQLENELFQQSITRFVPEGSTFQGVPIMFTTTAVQDVMATLECHNLVADLLSRHGRGVQFGLAVRRFAYPEGLTVTWLMLAVSYPSTSTPMRLR